MAPASDERIASAERLLAEFASRTGLTSAGREVRYLWTDAFAVCTWLSLFRARGDTEALDLARRLVDRVHHVLGRHRDDDVRRGFISGLSDSEGEAHPTRGGLRIGKPLPERGIDEPFDEELEWDRDGQYFHYLAKWMHALDQLSRATREPHYHRHACELALAAHAGFTTRRVGARTPRMIWKASIDLSRPLVASMGQHDPLDGLVTCLQLQKTGRDLGFETPVDGLDAAISDYAAMVAASELETTDPLGLGGLLADAFRIAQLGLPELLAKDALLDRVLDAATYGLVLYARQGEPSGPASRRLAFRELGLAIGLSAIERLAEHVRSGALVDADRVRIERKLDVLLGHVPLGDAITSFWLAPDARRARTWLEHRDINEVMLATSLVPEGFVVLGGSESPCEAHERRSWVAPNGR